ncbi:hypothetical protein NUU61_009619 [Penicillium alfredii]|uniref:Trafficking protein particle complex subunit n=1 Tax=Penicillium alfredii TaxID=1506179 RepID=A0A9W9EGN2_9EURO|nr:uncharacterized protein NUU61_009619 [Penicillium alfredii]KAJ5081355.1 hypothetical protein NUU61_009619 [Penicillium alfredii]
MAVYSFYIFDRHAECIYKRRWLPRPTSIVGKSSRSASETPTPGLGQTVRSTDDDSKLVFGTVFSLRNMVRKLGGEEDNFISYTTSQYKLHYYETPTNIKFVMLTDLKSPSMHIALQQIYINLFVEYVVKNPLSPTEHPGGVGVNNELFEESLEQFVDSGMRCSVHRYGLRMAPAEYLHEQRARLNMTLQRLRIIQHRLFEPWPVIESRVARGSELPEKGKLRSLASRVALYTRE